MFAQTRALIGSTITVEIAFGEKFAYGFVIAGLQSVGYGSRGRFYNHTVTRVAARVLADYSR